MKKEKKTSKKQFAVALILGTASSMFMLINILESPFFRIITCGLLAIIGYLIQKLIIEKTFNYLTKKYIKSLIEESLLNQRIIKIRNSLFELSSIFFILSFGYDPVVDFAHGLPVKINLDPNTFAIDLAVFFGVIGMYFAFGYVAYLFFTDQLFLKLKKGGK